MPNGIKDRHHNDWVGFGSLGGDPGCRHIRRENNIDLLIEQVGQHAPVLRVQDSLSVFDTDILSLDVAEFRQSFLKNFKPCRIGILGSDIAHQWNCLSVGLRTLHDGQQSQAEHTSTVE
jgi:hypothetical protein